MWQELTLDGEASWARRALVMYPARGEPGQTHPGLLLFHGRGETASESAALHAWRDGYGLVSSDARLRRCSVPPILRGWYLP